MINLHGSGKTDSPESCRDSRIESSLNSNSMKKKACLLALFAVFALCACVNKALYVGTWESESVEADDINMKIGLTLNKNDQLTLRIKGYGSTIEEGMTIHIGFSMKATGTWSVSYGKLTFNLDENSLSVAIDEISTGEPFTDAILAAMLEDESSKQELVDQMKSEIDISEFNGEMNVTSISEDRMTLEETEGEPITLYKK